MGAMIPLAPTSRARLTNVRSNADGIRIQAGMPVGRVVATSPPSVSQPQPVCSAS
jgi:hypothetical protein